MAWPVWLGLLNFLPGVQDRGQVLLGAPAQFQPGLEFFEFLQGQAIIPGRCGSLDLGEAAVQDLSQGLAVFLPQVFPLPIQIGL